MWYCNVASFVPISVHHGALNFREELFPRLKGKFSLEKIPNLFPSKITKDIIKNVIFKFYIALHTL